jgi:hypothetical protein
MGPLKSEIMPDHPVIADHETMVCRTDITYAEATIIEY